MVDIDLSSVPNVNLKIIFGVHFILITWGIQGYWSPDSYLFYNILFLLALMWGIHSKESVDPVQIAVAIDGLSIFLDLIAIGLNFPAFYAAEKFSVAMALVNLALRPITVVMLARICSDRMGDEGLPHSFGNLFGGNDYRGPYEDIESGGTNQLHHNVPTTESADFTPTYH